MLVYFFNLKKLTPPLSEYSELEKMLAFRKMGFSYTVLADTFGVPKTTIRYLCRKFGLDEQAVTVTVIRQRTTTPKPKQTYNEDRINPGKTYKEYLKEEQDRKWRRLTQK